MYGFDVLICQGDVREKYDGRVTAGRGMSGHAGTTAYGSCVWVSHAGYGSASEQHSMLSYSSCNDGRRRHAGFVCNELGLSTAYGVGARQDDGLRQDDDGVDVVSGR